MTAVKQARSCADCRYSGTPGVHWIDPAEGAEFDADALASLEPYSVPCPVRAVADERERLQAIVAEHAKGEKDAATNAARKIVTDAAERFTVPFSANDLRPEIKAAQLEKRGGLMGAAFSWASTHGYIEWTGRMVKSNEPGTNEHPLHEWKRSAVAAISDFGASA